MFKRLLLKAGSYLPLWDALRAILEANHRGEKRVIGKEFGGTQGSVLDVPCGTGTFSTFFSRDQYTGIDLGENYVRYAGKKNPMKEFFVMDALNMTFTDDSFDNVLVIGFLHHLSDEEAFKALMEIKRVLKPDGKFLLIEDAPTRGKWNVLGRYLQKLDEGENIRPAEYYEYVLKDLFTIERTYPMRAGIWDYSVFVLRKEDFYGSKK